MRKLKNYRFLGRAIDKLSRNKCQDPAGNKAEVFILYGKKLVQSIKIFVQNELPDKWQKVNIQTI